MEMLGLVGAKVIGKGLVSHGPWRCGIKGLMFPWDSESGGSLGMWATPLDPIPGTWVLLWWGWGGIPPNANAGGWTEGSCLGIHSSWMMKWIQCWVTSCELLVSRMLFVLAVERDLFIDG